MNELRLATLKEGGERTTFKIGDTAVGSDFLLIVGPCSVESREQIGEAARIASLCGANFLRGGAFKPRTSPYSFRGLGKEGLEYLRRAGDEYNLPVVTEVVDTRDMALVCEYADVIQIGARNMQNFALLTEAGKTDKPILLKRGTSATLEELLNSAEYILSEGNSRVILCERGVRTHETYTRNTLDISAVPALKELTHLPVIVDPSHATGRRSLIRPMSLASVAAGCDGLEIEFHPHPERALSDSEQQLNCDELLALAADIRAAVEFEKSLR